MADGDRIAKAERVASLVTSAATALGVVVTVGLQIHAAVVAKKTLEQATVAARTAALADDTTRESMRMTVRMASARAERTGDPGDKAAAAAAAEVLGRNESGRTADAVRPPPE